MKPSGLMAKLVREVLGQARTIAVVCTQWGDSGKGKFVDVFAEWADVIARCTGGGNAGHTIKVGPRTHILHLVPSGILYDAAGKANIIGGGVAFDPRTFLEELSALAQTGLSYENLFIAMNAHLVLPQHLLMDRLAESAAGEGKIGTTGKGIGPVYVDHYGRVGLTVNDMQNPDAFRRKLERNLAEKRRLLAHFDPELVRTIMRHKDLGSGEFWNASGFLDSDAIIGRYLDFGLELRDMVRDTDQIMRDAVGRKRILLEGAQGNLLSVDRGTYPYVTSSDCSVQGMARGAGLREQHVDLALGIVKAFYMTRVGGGPFPTEIGGEESARWCNTAGVTEELEQERYHDASVNSPDPFSQGIGIRRAGKEYGATTRRPRRTGWLDLPLLRYSKRFTGPDAILTKLDVLDQADSVQICTSYAYEGPDYVYGDRVLRQGETLDTAIPDPDVMRRCVPVYQSFEGWRCDISGIRTFEELPPNLRRIIAFVGGKADLSIRILSVGPDREQTIVV